MKDVYSHDDARDMATLFAVAPKPEDEKEVLMLYEQPIWTRPFRQEQSTLLALYR